MTVERESTRLVDAQIHHLTHLYGVNLFERDAL